MSSGLGSHVSCCSRSHSTRLFSQSERCFAALVHQHRGVLASLAESVEFDSEEEYREKLEYLKESYFSRNPAPSKASAPQTLSEGVDSTSVPVSTGMEQYMRALGAFKKN